MSRTNLYTIQFLSVDSAMCRALTISRAEYLRQREHLEQLLTTSAGDECPAYHHDQRRENDRVGILADYYTLATGTTILTHIYAKPGYSLK